MGFDDAKNQQLSSLSQLMDNPGLFMSPR